MKHKLFKGAAAAFVIMAALLPVTAMAAQFRGDKSGSTAVSEPVNDDLYAAGSTVTVGSAVSGDAVLAGGNVLVTGTVGKSVLVAGGTITVIGNVADNVRIVGGNVYLNGNVGHDVIVLGGQVNISSTAKVGGDLIVLGGMATIDGAINGNVYARGGDVVVNASVGGSVDAASKTLVLGNKAHIAGKLIYSSPTEILVGSGVVGAGVEYTKMKPRESGSAKTPVALAGFIAVIGLIKILTLIVITLALVAIFKKRANTLAQGTLLKFGWNVLYGFAALVAIPVAAIILLVTVIGAPVAVVAIAAYVIMLVLSGFLAPVVIGAWLWKMIKRQANYQVNIYSTLIGLAAYLLVAVIPFLGWLFDFAFVMAALGMLVCTVGSSLGSKK